MPRTEQCQQIPLQIPLTLKYKNTGAFSQLFCAQWGYGRRDAPDLRLVASDVNPRAVAAGDAGCSAVERLRL